MKKRVFRKRYEIKVHEKLEKPKAEVVVVEEPKEEIEEKPLKPRKERIWKQ